MRQMRDRVDKADVTCKSKAELNPENSGFLITDLDTFTVVRRLEN